MPILHRDNTRIVPQQGGKKKPFSPRRYTKNEGKLMDKGDRSVGTGICRVVCQKDQRPVSAIQKVRDRFPADCIEHPFTCLIHGSDLVRRHRLVPVPAFIGHCVVYEGLQRFHLTELIKDFRSQEFLSSVPDHFDRIHLPDDIPRDIVASAQTEHSGIQYRQGRQITVV